VLEQRHDVLAARTGEEAIQIVRSNKELDVILLETSLPRMSGTALCEEIRRIHEPLVDRVVFVSGGLLETEVARYLERTTNRVLAKPLDPAELSELIAAMVR
jgi:CheY-like chemotaxis protein